jgi:large conductance mechanosensitive channel
MVKNRLKAAEPEEKPIPADTALLAEIRDLLANLAGPDAAATRGRVGEHPDGEHLDGEHPEGGAPAREGAVV